MKIIKKKLSEIKFDENQPRQKFEKGFIEALAKSIEEEGMINMVEIDENNVIITGELRFRALQELGFEEYEFELIENLPIFNKRMRQLAENSFRANLSFEERENEVFELFTESGLTQEEFGKRVNLTQTRIGQILRAKRVRDNLKEWEKDGKLEAGSISDISTKRLSEVAPLPVKQQVEAIEVYIAEKEYAEKTPERLTAQRIRQAEKDKQPEIFRYEADLKSNLQELEIIERRLGLIYSAVKKKYDDLLKRPDDALLGFLETKYEDIAHNQYDQITEAEGSTVRNLEELKYMAKRTVDEDLGKCPFCLNEINLDRNLTQQVIYEHELKDFGKGKEKLAREKYQLEEWMEKIDDYERKVVYFESRIEELKNKIEVLKEL